MSRTEAERLAEELAATHAVDPDTFRAALALAGIYAPEQAEDTADALEDDLADMMDDFVILFDLDGRAF